MKFYNNCESFAKMLVKVCGEGPAIMLQGSVHCPVMHLYNANQALY